MNTHRLKNPVFILAGAVLIALIGLPAAAQTKPAAPAYKLEDLAGDYEFSVEGQTLLIRFVVTSGKLYGAPPDETPEEITPVKDKPLCFEVTTTDGQYYFMKFEKNDQGVFDTCLMSAQGMDITGKKIIKS